MIEANNMILLGATGRNIGKTTLAVKLIEAHSKAGSVAAVKVVTVQHEGDACPRGGRGCGICSSLNAAYDISEEQGSGKKDTMLFRAAGAQMVLLVRAHPHGLQAAMAEVLTRVGHFDYIICESNSVRTVVKPGQFIMMVSADGQVKESAQAVLSQADLCLTSCEEYPW